MKAIRFFDVSKNGLTIPWRAVFSLLLAAITTLCMSCSQATVASKTPDYTPAQLEQIQKYASNVEELRDRMLEIPPLVQRQQWGDVETFVHGPLGELRSKMSTLTRSLAPDAQEPAREAAKAVFGHLIQIDEAVKAEDNRKALSNYNGALQDFDAFLQLVPPGAIAPAAPAAPAPEGN